MDRKCVICKKKKPARLFYKRIGKWKDKTYRASRRRDCKKCCAARNLKHHYKYQAKRNARRQLMRAAKRLYILSMYCGGKDPFCQCCGETEVKFLAFDHIKGGGVKQTKKLGGQDNFFRWMIRYKFPKSIQVLCHNCNLAKGFYGQCPHIEKRNNGASNQELQKSN